MSGSLRASESLGRRKTDRTGPNGIVRLRFLIRKDIASRLTCPGCREMTCANLPPGVPTGQSGPRLIAFTALLSVIETCRQQKRSVLDHVTSAVTAHFHGQPTPTLIPRA
jgi:hypothetical protein